MFNVESRDCRYLNYFVIIYATEHLGLDSQNKGLKRGVKRHEE